MVGKQANRLSAIGRAERSTRRRKLGCWAIILLPIVLLIVALVGFSRDNAEWQGLRPPGTSEQSWRELRDHCLALKLSSAECASTPRKKIAALAAEQSAAERAELCARDDRFKAGREAEKAVRASLKAPSTADFGDARIQHNGCRWIVSGDVDAQNSFGAKMRSTYRVELLRLGEDLWTPVAVRVSE